MAGAPEALEQVPEFHRSSLAATFAERDAELGHIVATAYDPERGKYSGIPALPARQIIGIVQHAANQARKQIDANAAMIEDLAQGQAAEIFVKAQQAPTLSSAVHIVANALSPESALAIRCGLDKRVMNDAETVPTLSSAKHLTHTYGTNEARPALDVVLDSRSGERLKVLLPSAPPFI